MSGHNRPEKQVAVTTRSGKSTATPKENETPEISGAGIEAATGEDPTPAHTDSIPGGEELGLIPTNNLPSSVASPSLMSQGNNTSEAGSGVTLAVPRAVSGDMLPEIDEFGNLIWTENNREGAAPVETFPQQRVSGGSTAGGHQDTENVGSHLEAADSTSASVSSSSPQAGVHPADSELPNLGTHLHHNYGAQA